MKEKKISFARKQFNDDFNDLTEKELQLEILNSLRVNNIKLEKIRSNTSTMVWFFIVIPIVIFILAAMLPSLR